MLKLLNCLECNLEYVYEDCGLLICLECGYEWSVVVEEVIEEKVFKDVNGNVLIDGDFVIVIKDFKVKGVLNLIKMGIKVKNICLVDGDYDIDCKIDGFGLMKLKLEFVKKI